MNDIPAYEAYRSADIESKRLREIGHTELSRYRECQRCLARIEEKIIKQESRINAVVRPLQSPDEHPAIQHTSDPKQIENLLVNASELRRFYAGKMAYSTKRLYAIEKLIDASGLSETQIAIVDLLYIRGERSPSRRDAAKILNYSRAGFYKILDVALERVGKRVDTRGHTSAVK